MEKYQVGSRLYQHYGNGFRYDTIIKIIDRYYIECAGMGIVSKNYIGMAWSISKY